MQRFRRRGSRQAEAESRAAQAGAAAAAAAGADAILTAPRDPTAAAFFDVDNTMMAGASIYYFARGLAARDYFTSRDLVRFVWQQVQFRVAGKESAASMVQAQEAALAFVAGRNVEEIVRISEEVYDELMADRVYSGTRALAQQHLDAGQRVWLVTATPIELARIISRRLGLSGALGTVAEVVDGVYTGRLYGEPMHGKAKAEAVKALAEREGLDLSRCAAYSDSANDVPMLSLVGHPTAVNPDADLRRIARQRGWLVVDFRTGRKAAKVAIPTGAGLGAAAGLLLAAERFRRRREPPGVRVRRTRPAAA
jgi:HAD superfamily hydrolase (TIGR01490 family)